MIVTTSAEQSGVIAGQPAGPTPADLAELMGQFNEVTAKLEATHTTLRAEVSRLTGELRDANIRLERSRRLAALGEMAAGIAHEIRNPLGGIGLYAKMLIDDLDAPEAMVENGFDEQRETAEKIAAAVRRLNAIVGDVLHFAREANPRPEAVSVASLLTDAWEACAGEAELRFGDGFEPRVKIAPEAKTIVCDATLMHQALVNLVMNACQAMAECEHEPRLDLIASVGSVMVGGDQVADMITLAVRDRGPGVPDEVVERMFNPFFTTRATGTGLGLAIVHRIADAHDGGVVVTNNASIDEAVGSGFDVGTTVEIRVPARGAAFVDESSDTQPASETRPASTSVRQEAAA